MLITHLSIKAELFRPDRYMKGYGVGPLGGTSPYKHLLSTPSGGGVLNHLSNLRKMPFLLASCSLPGRRFSYEFL